MKKLLPLLLILAGCSTERMARQFERRTTGRIIHTVERWRGGDTVRKTTVNYIFKP